MPSKLAQLRRLRADAESIREGKGPAGAPLPSPPPAASPDFSASSPLAEFRRSPLLASSPLSRSPALPGPGDGFLAAARFAGRRAGYVFTTGEHGLGYYPDRTLGLARVEPVPGATGRDGLWRPAVGPAQLRHLECLSKMQTLRLEAEGLWGGA